MLVREMHCAGCGALTKHTEFDWWLKRNPGLSGTAIQIESAGMTNYPWCENCAAKDVDE